MKKHFITGLIILLPLAITLMVLVFLINFLTQPFIGIVSTLFKHVYPTDQGFFFLSSEQLIRYSSQILILILLFLLTTCLGIIARLFFIHALFRLGDRILLRVPIVSTVYKTTQDIIKTLFVSDKNTFKQVVMVPFPHPGTYVLGLVARASPTACQHAAKEDLISVFVPTTPNPTTGFVLMLKKADLVYVDIKSEDALKYIISCGVIMPKEIRP